MLIFSIKWAGNPLGYQLRLLVLTAMCGLSAAGQFESREDEIQRQRQARLTELHTEEVSRAELLLRRVKDEKILERFSTGFNGFRAKLGGMVTGGGFGFGPEYFREDLASGRLKFRAAAQTSIRNYQKYETEILVPSFARDRLFFNFTGIHHNYPGLPYYGPGPDSAKTGRSNYRLEDTAADGTLGLRLRPGLVVGGSTGYLWVNAGPGKDGRFISADRQYTPRQTPGIDSQTNFHRYGGFAQFDYRDNPDGPRSGGNYIVQFSRFNDRQLGRHDFNRLEVELQQYIGLFNQRRVFALRARTVLTDTPGGHSVPFYLQPVLGGSDSLRGFRPFRFTDNNLLMLNGEYRWEAFSGLDMAVFVDGGKVFARRGQLNFRDLEGSAGFGLRFNARNRTFLRVDVGFSHEGVQVWFKFNDIFAQRPFGSSSSQPLM